MMMTRKWKTMMAMIDALMLGNKTKTREKGFPEGLIILRLRKTTRDDDDDIAGRGIHHTQPQKNHSVRHRSDDDDDMSARGIHHT